MCRTRVHYSIRLHIFALFFRVQPLSFILKNSKRLSTVREKRQSTEKIRWFSYYKIAKYRVKLTGALRRTKACQSPPSIRGKKRREKWLVILKYPILNTRINKITFPLYEWNSHTTFHRCFILEMRKGKNIQAYSIINQSILQVGLYYVKQRETKCFIFLAHSCTTVPEHQTNVDLIVFQIHPWVLSESTAMPFWCYCKIAKSFTARKPWKALQFVMRVLKKGNRNTKFSLHVTGTSYTWIWVCMLGSMQRTDKCVGPSTEESCSIYKLYEGFWLGNLGSA